MNTETENDAPQLRDYEQAKADCLAYIAELGITAEIKANGVHETQGKGKDDKPWLHFRWNCAVTRSGKAIGGNHWTANFDDYKTGIGNATCMEKRSPSSESFQIYELAKKGQIHRFTDPQTRLDACRYLKPKAPDLADILGSYARDYVDANRAGSFEDFAAEMGYDEDSRKAEDIYRACLAQRKPFMQLGLSMAEIEKIADYAYQF